MTKKKRLDLNTLQEKVEDGLRNGSSADPKHNVFVDRDGNIVCGSDAQAGQVLTEVPPDGFSAGEAERAFVARSMPRETVAYATPDGLSGWLYPVRSALGDPYHLFTYYDGAFWQTMVVSPEIEKSFATAHDGHLFMNGKICLSGKFGSGAQNLATAFSRSCLWVTAAAITRKTGQFPF